MLNKLVKLKSWTFSPPLPYPWLPIIITREA